MVNAMPMLYGTKKMDIKDRKHFARKGKVLFFIKKAGRRIKRCAVLHFSYIWFSGNGKMKGNV